MPLVVLSDLVNLYSSEEKTLKDYRANSWLPLYPSPKLAGLVSDLMADGHLQGPNKWRFDYCSKSVAELKRFEKILVSLFGVKGKIRPCTTN